ncbi:hypothetical protein EYF80_012761 [Liparis tanakae]|uniref:Uncharacterized protein n=1 Tax=Liparis tanakae TaxID=230148 RepID=A0A4Z2IGU8_9TELE|nr:hypothetical protein EYF80_012761 [Liparis tanakae]
MSLLDFAGKGFQLVGNLTRAQVCLTSAVFQIKPPFDGYYFQQTLPHGITIKIRLKESHQLQSHDIKTVHKPQEEWKIVFLPKLHHTVNEQGKKGRPHFQEDSLPDGLLAHNPIESLLSSRTADRLVTADVCTIYAEAIKNDRGTLTGISIAAAKLTASSVQNSWYTSMLSDTSFRSSNASRISTVTSNASFLLVQLAPQISFSSLAFSSLSGFSKKHGHASLLNVRVERGIWGYIFMCCNMVNTLCATGSNALAKYHQTLNFDNSSKVPPRLKLHAVSYFTSGYKQPRSLRASCLL